MLKAGISQVLRPGIQKLSNARKNSLSVTLWIFKRSITASVNVLHAYFVVAVVDVTCGICVNNFFQSTKEQRTLKTCCLVS